LEGFSLEQMQDVGPGTISDHGHCARRIADPAGEQLARDRNVHFGNDVVIARGPGHDPLQHRVSLALAAEPAVKLREREVDEQELLLLVPIFEDRRIGVGSPNAPVAARRDLQKPHPVHRVADDIRIADDPEIDDRDQRSVDVVLESLLERSAQPAAADEGQVEALLKQRGGLKSLPRRHLVAGTLRHVRELAQADDRHGGREGEMLLVLLPLLPDRRVAGDDQPAAIVLGVGQERLHDEVAGAL
jgi:hypothetical protein